MSSAPATGKGELFRFATGDVVQEFYSDEDCDQDLRAAVEEVTGNPIVDEAYGDVVDGALVWWRAEYAAEEDLADLLVDAMANLDNGGDIWVFTPKPGREGHVPPGEVEDAATTAGMHATSVISAGPAWSGIRLNVRGRER